MTYSVVPVTNREMLEQAFRVRKEVFIDEQKVPEDLEMDEFDEAPETLHILVRDGEGQTVGTARIRPYTEPGVGKVERVAVNASHRRKGLGSMIMEALESHARERGFSHVHLHAQVHAQDFYERLGYTAHGDHFDDAGIEHVAMDKVLG